MLLTFLFAALVGLILSYASGGPSTLSGILLIEIFIFSLAYGISRSKYYLLSIALTLVVIWSTVLIGVNLVNTTEMLYLLMLGSLVGSFFLSPRTTILLSVAGVATILLLALFSPVAQFDRILSEVFFVGLVGALASVAALVKNQDQRRITEQSSELSNHVAELTRSREALQRSETRLAEILENAAEAIISIDESQNIILFNKGAEKIFGYLASEVLGQSLDILLPQIYGEIHRQHVIRFSADQQASQSLRMRREVRGLRKDGTEFLAHVGISRHLENGQMVFTAVMIDISDRKSAEERLQKSESLLQLQIDRMPVACIVWDTDLRATSWNPAAEKIYGYHAGEAVGRHPGDLFAANKVNGDQNEIWARLLEGGNKAHAVVENSTKDGRTIICEWSNTSLKDANGRFIGVLSMVKDITERKRAEEALVASEIRYRSLFDRIPVALYRTSSGGQILETNPALVDLLGYPDRESLLSANISDAYVDLEDRAKQNALLEKDGQYHGLHYQLRCHDGHTIWVRDTSRLVKDLDGNILYYEGSLEDITEQMQAEELIRKNSAQSQELAEISQMIVEAGFDYQSILDIVTRRVAGLFGDSCALNLLSEEGNKLQQASFHRPQLAGHTQLQPQPAEVIQDVRASIQGQELQELNERVAKTGEAVLFAEIPEYAFEATDHLSTPGKILEQNIHGILIVPLRAQGRVIGTLGVTRESPREIYTSDDRVFLQEIADWAALVIANAQLFVKSQRNLDKVQALRQVDIAITGSVDLRISIGIILDHVMNQMGMDAAHVLVLNPHTLILEYTTGKGFRTNALQDTNLRLGEGYAGKAALERRILTIPDLRIRQTDFLRSPIFYAEDFVTYFAVPLVAKGQVKGVLEIFHRSRIDLDRDRMEFLEALAGQAAIAIDNASLFNDLQRSNQELMLAYDATIEGWSHALDLRDNETEGHTRRVTEMTMRLARSLGVSEFDLADVRRGALLHDIGKMGIPDSILLKSGPLTKDEWVLMRKHPIYAHKMLSQIAYLKPAMDIPYCHHEKWDGSGYPRGLKGDQIPLFARIFAVVDVWDGLCSDRPYRPAWSKEKAKAYILEQSGEHFDPAVVDQFIKLLEIEAGYPSSE